MALPAAIDMASRGRTVDVIAIDASLQHVRASHRVDDPRAEVELVPPVVVSAFQGRDHYEVPEAFLLDPIDELVDRLRIYPVQTQQHKRVQHDGLAPERQRDV